MRKIILSFLLVFVFSSPLNAAPLNLDNDMSVWWSSSTKSRIDTALGLVKKMDGIGKLKSQNELHLEISANLVLCVENATEGLSEINNTQSIGTILLLCFFQLEYM